MPACCALVQIPAMPAAIETDYLIIGAGAAGLAFADTLLTESDAHITIVDMRSQVGGHWNDAYPFVALHQPSAFYGVNSLELSSGRKYTAGANAGMYEMASGTQVLAYFQRVMDEKLLPNGRVVYRPMSQLADGHRIVSLLNGAETPVTVRRKVVDATRFSPRVPATEPPPFAVVDGAQVVSPSGLTQRWQGARAGERVPAHYCIVGAGKTGMDTGVWLLEQGVAPEQISWVMPRDSWIVNRVTTQNGPEFFDEAIGGALRQLQALAEAKDIDDLFLRLEATGQMLRIDPKVTPRMCHFATISEGEVAVLRRIPHIIREGRVQAINREGLTFASGATVRMPANTLYINCTASAIDVLANNEPIFQPGKIVPQLVRAPLVSFSCAMVAYVEAHYDDDAQKNALCRPVPLKGDLPGYVRTNQLNLVNQAAWSQDKGLRNWMRNIRLDAFSALVASVAPTETDKINILGQLRAASMAAAMNIPKLLAAG